MVRPNFSIIKLNWVILNKFFCGVFVIIISTLSIFSQNRNFGTLSLIEKQNNQLLKIQSFTSPILRNDSLKLAICIKVFNRLVESRGDKRTAVPKFILSKREESVASIDYDRLEITLEEKAYDLCIAIGDSTNSEAAIAYLLGHELTHYYEKHAWRRGFATHFKDLDIGLKIQDIQDDILNETQADYLGGFLAYTAGYGFFNKTPELIQSIYSAYNLPDSLSKYPTLSDRKKICFRTLDRLQDLIQIFEMANFLNIVGEYIDANEYYKFVLQDYQSRELYNNVGVNILLDAITNYERHAGSVLDYKYPIELDLEARGPRFPVAQSSTSTQNNGGIIVQRINPFLFLVNQSIFHFDAAISLDPYYAPAYLNKACALSLTGENERARFYSNIECRLVAKNKYKKTEIDIDVLLGIMEAKDNQIEKAKNIFQSAAANGSSIAHLNFKRLINGPKSFEEMEIITPIIINDTVETNVANEEHPVLLISQKTYNPAKHFADEEQIDSVNLDSMIKKGLFPLTKSTIIDKNLNFSKSITQKTNSFLHIAENFQTDKMVFFLGTNPTYKGKTFRGISIGSKLETVLKYYGEPLRTIESTVGQILAYKNIIFVLGLENKVERWLIYNKV